MKKLLLHLSALGLCLLVTAAGTYMLILSTYSTIWDELNVRDTTTGTRATGAATVRIACFTTP